MLSSLLSNKKFELNFVSGSILEGINTSSEEATVTDIGAIGSMYGKNVAGFLNTVRNEIIPAMGKAEDLLMGSIGSKDFSIKNTYNIVKLTLPTLFSNLKDNGGLNLVGNGMLPMASVTLPTPARENIRSWFITDSEDVNYDITGVLTIKTDDDLVNIWEKYLYSFSSENNLLKDLNLFHYSKTEELMLLYAAVRNLSVRGPGLVSNLGNFNSSVINIFDYVKAMIAKYISLYSISSDNMLVHSVRMVDGYTNIYVFDKAYERFVSTSTYGVDSIIGYAIKLLQDNDNSFSATVEKILADEERFYKIAMQNIDMLKLRSNKDKIEGYILSYRVLGATLYKDILSLMSSPVAEDVYNSIYQNLLVNTENEHNELNVELFVKNLFCAIYPRVKKFLDITTQMDSDSNDDGLTLTPSEVVLYATIEMITSELMDQVSVTEVSTYKV